MSTIQRVSSHQLLTVLRTASSTASNDPRTNGFIDWREIPGGTFAPRLDQARTGAQSVSR